MTKPIVISVAGEPQGVVIPNGSDFRFMAVKLGVFPIDGKIFQSIEAARRAAEKVVEGSSDLAGALERAHDSDADLVA